MTVLLSLGSNLGDRERNLLLALATLDNSSRVKVIRGSRMYETEPMGFVEQPWFLNMAAEIETGLAPLELLDAIKETETALGRTPTARWGPRIIDIDIVLWGDLVFESERLSIPHPEFRRRSFVLAPLAEIAGPAVDPVTGRTVQELAQASGLDGELRVYRPVGHGHSLDDTARAVTDH